ncbi:hypothetical protein GCM10022243_67300 [Saccharothrix violaceirubra]
MGRYLLVDPLGEGGAGSVWRVWDLRSRRYLAVKLLRAADAAALLRFVREQSLRVDHPHVVAPSGWAAEEDEVLLTMDLVGGGDVERLLGDFGKLPLTFAAALVDQLLDALTVVHGHGIVHRDIKPANLLLEPTGTGRPFLRLADFGIAAVIGEPRLTDDRIAVGTRGYIAPECVLGALPDVRQDLYAVGVLTCRLLTGQPPSTEAFDDLPQSLRPLVSALCAESPDDRPASASAARKDWLAAMDLAGSEPLDPADPHPVEVFEHLDPLPPGYGPDGPVTVAASDEMAADAQPSRARPTRRRVAVTAGCLAVAAGIVTPITMSTMDVSGKAVAPTSGPVATRDGSPPFVAAPPGTNLLPDPGAEAYPPNWTAFGSGVVGQDDIRRTGSKSLRVTTTATGANSAGATTRSDSSRTAEGTTYRAECWVRSSGRIGVFLQVQEYTPDWQRVGEPVPSAKTALDDPGRWFPVSVTYTATRGGNLLPITVFSNNLRAGGDALLVDDCSLTTG